MEQFGTQTSENPWPAQEGDRKLETPFGVLSEELRMYRTHDDFCKSIRGIEILYWDTPLTDSFDQYTEAVAELVAHERQLDTDDLYESILAGSLLGIYAGIYQYPQSMRDFIVEQQFTDAPDPDKYPSENPDEYVNRCMETYTDDIDDQYEIFKTLPEAEQSILTLIADRACTHLGHQYEPYFIAGVMKSFHQLRPIIDYYYGQIAGN